MINTPPSPFAVKARLNPLFSQKQEEPAVDENTAAEQTEATTDSAAADAASKEIPVRLASAAPIVAAIAFRPEFANLASSDKQVSEKAAQDTRPLFTAFSTTAGEIAAMGVYKREAIAATAHVIGEAWINGDDLEQATANLKTYAKAMVEAKGSKSFKSILGKPSRGELANPEQAAKSLSARQIAFSAIIDSKDPELTDWFINETRHDSQEAIIAGLNAAPKIIDGQIYTASLIDSAKEIVRLSVAAAISHAEHIHRAITASAGASMANAILMDHDRHMEAVKRNVIEFALASTENLPLTDGGVPDEVNLAQAMGTTVNEIAKIWLNVRVAAYNRVGAAIPAEVRKNLSSDDANLKAKAESDLRALTTSRPMIEAANAASQVALARRQKIVDCIPTVDLRYASTQLKTRAALATYLTDADDIAFVEGAIDKAARAFSGYGEPMNLTRHGVPVLLADQGSIGLDYMTMHSALRDIAKSTLRLEPDAAHVVEALRLSMDAFTKLANIDMGKTKEALVAYGETERTSEDNAAVDRQEVAA